MAKAFKAMVKAIKVMVKAVKIMVKIIKVMVKVITNMAKVEDIKTAKAMVEAVKDKVSRSWSRPVRSC